MSSDLRIFLVKTTATVLAFEILKPQLALQFSISVKFFPTSEHICLRFDPHFQTALSSANMEAFAPLCGSGRSFIIIRNSSGLITLLCGDHFSKLYFLVILSPTLIGID